MESTGKGILKKKGADIKGESMGIKWDEEVIKAHDKERGKISKIPEPKTPYREGSDNEDEEMEDAPDVDEIKQHLNEAEENAKKNALEFSSKTMELLHEKLAARGDGIKDEDDEDLDEEERQRREEFKKKMKSHYKGEFNAAKLLKKKYE